MIKILVVDDHVIVRKGIKRVLSEVSDIEVTEEASDGHQALSIIRSQPLDVVVMDISMPGRSGLEILKMINKNYTELPVIMLTIYPEDQYAARALKAGASGYLTIDCIASQLVTAIRKVANGGKYISSKVVENLVAALQGHNAQEANKSLSDREFEVLRLIASGKTASQIAGQLILSCKTVSTYRSRILKKMKMHINAELTNYAIKNGLIF